MCQRRYRTLAGILAGVLLPFVAMAADYLTPALTPEELYAQLQAGEALLIVDVRDPHEFNYVRVPGAVNIPVADLESRLADIEAAERTLLYCMDGRRTRQAEQILLDHDIGNLYHLQGSLPAWVQGGYPIEKGRPERTTQ